MPLSTTKLTNTPSSHLQHSQASILLLDKSPAEHPHQPFSYLSIFQYTDPLPSSLPTSPGPGCSLPLRTVKQCCFICPGEVRLPYPCAGCLSAQNQISNSLGTGFETQLYFCLLMKAQTRAQDPGLKSDSVLRDVYGTSPSLLWWLCDNKH